MEKNEVMKIGNGITHRVGVVGFGVVVPEPSTGLG